MQRLKSISTDNIKIMGFFGDALEAKEVRQVLTERVKEVTSRADVDNIDHCEMKLLKYFCKH